MDSNYSFDKLEQNVSISEPGNYIISVKWMPPSLNPLTYNNIGIKVNNTLVYTVACNASNIVYSFNTA